MGERGLVAYRVLVTPRSFGAGSDEPIRILEEAGCEVVWATGNSPLTEDELLGQVRGIDGMIVGLDQVSSRVIAAADRLRVISKYGVGLNNIDLQEARSRGIVVTYTPNANTEAVADLTMGLLLACARKIPMADRSVRSGEWRRFIGSAVWKKTIGIVGTGRIGRAVVRRATGFNMRILCCDKVEDPAFAAHYRAEYVPLDDLLRESDYVTLHVPLTEETAGFIGSREFSLMKKTAFLINTARGEVVDEEALYHALSTGRIAGAALDVFCSEPPTGSRLLSLDNVVLTPHMGAHAVEAIIEMGLAASRNVIAVLRGEEPEAVAR
ncbi:MAG TPA: phosphoglycerate dehydrogenase [Firmicutes bacterium]|nr:phosphoglycerate dehydrogenase [Bacillota bacterium]